MRCTIYRSVETSNNARSRYSVYCKIKTTRKTNQLKYTNYMFIEIDLNLFTRNFFERTTMDGSCRYVLLHLNDSQYVKCTLIN